MSTISRQLSDWCRRRNYQTCRDFLRQLDDTLVSALDLSPDTLLEACRSLSTGFFRENRLDRESIAQELSELLEMPKVAVRLVKVIADQPFNPLPVEAEEVRPDLFISYFHEDGDLVRRLASALAERGFVVWYDQVGLTGGISFPLVIERALESTRYVGLIATSISVARPWVKKERAAALQRETEEDRSILIPIRLDDSKLPLFVRATHWCDFRGGFEEGVEQVIAAMREADGKVV